MLVYLGWYSNHYENSFYSDCVHGVFKSRLTIFVDISLVGTGCTVSRELETNFVRWKTCDHRTEITLLNKLFKSALFDNYLKKSSI